MHMMQPEIGMPGAPGAGCLGTGIFMHSFVQLLVLYASCVKLTTRASSSATKLNAGCIMWQPAGQARRQGGVRWVRTNRPGYPTVHLKSSEN